MGAQEERRLAGDTGEVGEDVRDPALHRLSARADMNVNVSLGCLARQLLSLSVRERDRRYRDGMDKRRLDGPLVARRPAVEDDDRPGAGRDRVPDLDEEEEAAAAADERDRAPFEGVEIGALAAARLRFGVDRLYGASTSPLPE
jgi:hypothetical protein